MLRPLTRQKKTLQYSKGFMPLTLFLVFFKNQLTTLEINSFKHQLKILYFSTKFLARRLSFGDYRNPLFKNELFFSQNNYLLDYKMLTFYKSLLVMLVNSNSFLIKFFGQFPNVFLTQKRLVYIISFFTSRRNFSLDLFFSKIKKVIYILYQVLLNNIKIYILENV